MEREEIHSIGEEMEPTTKSVYHAWDNSLEVPIGQFGLLSNTGLLSRSIGLGGGGGLSCGGGGLNGSLLGGGSVSMSGVAAPWEQQQQLRVSGMMPPAPLMMFSGGAPAQMTSLNNSSAFNYGGEQLGGSQSVRPPFAPGQPILPPVTLKPVSLGDFSGMGWRGDGGGSLLGGGGALSPSEGAAAPSTGVPDGLLGA